MKYLTVLNVNNRKGSFLMKQINGGFKMTKTYDEEIQSTEEEITQLQNRMKQLLQQSKIEERKARTRRLIERGAILESLINGSVNMTNEQIKIILATVLQSNAATEIIKNLQGFSGEG